MERYGNQSPSKIVVANYFESKGPEAIEIYEKSGRKALDWQKDLVNHILAYNEDGLWTHSKFGYSVPRRNGKSELLFMVEAYFLQEGLRVMHTAHRTTTSHSAWERICDILDRAGIQYQATKQMGLETIRCETGGRISFRTRSSKGGLGENADLLIIDEAQEYTEDQRSALVYIVTDSKNPLTLFCGTPPTPVSAGTVFLNMRNKALRGELKNTGWAEWSVDDMTDPHNVDAWYNSNPSLGHVFTERAVEDEIGDDETDFNIQRLGLWLKYNQKSAISKVLWDSVEGPVPSKLAKMNIAIKFSGQGLENAVLGYAARMDDGRVFVGVADCRPTLEGFEWIARFIAQNTEFINKIYLDGKGHTQVLYEQLKAKGLHKKIAELSSSEYIYANSLFEQKLYAHEIVHAGQPALNQSASNCEKAAIGTGGGFKYKSLKQDIEIGLLDAVVIAHWAASTQVKRKPQTISY